MGKLVAPIEYLRSTLAAAITYGGALRTKVNSLRVGTVPETIAAPDLPMVAIRLGDKITEGLYTHGAAFFAATMQITVDVYAACDDGADLENMLYDTSSGTGILYILELVADTISADTSWASSVQAPPVMEYGPIERVGNVMHGSIEISAITALYNHTGRST